MNSICLNGSSQDAGARVVYVSDMPPVSSDTLTLFDGYPDLLTPAHLAEITDQCEATIRALCNKGKLPAVRIGKRWYVPKTAMIKYVEGRRNGR